MTKYIALLICCCAFGFVSYGQNDAESTSDTLSNKLQLGLNAAQIWSNESFTIPSIMTQFRVFDNVHVRAQVGFRSDNNDGERTVVVNNAFFSNGTIDSVISFIPGADENIFLSIGISNYSPLIGRFDLYYGGDFMFNRKILSWKEDMLVDQVFQQGNVTHFHNTNEYDVKEITQGIALFGGLRMRVNSRLSMGIESSFRFTATDVTEKRITKNLQWNEFNPQQFETGNESKGTWREIHYGFRPVSGLYVLVHI